MHMEIPIAVMSFRGAKRRKAKGERRKAKGNQKHVDQVYSGIIQ